VVGFDHARTYLMPLVPAAELAEGARVKTLKRQQHFGVGPQLLGRVMPLTFTSRP